MPKERMQLLSHHVGSIKYLYPSKNGMEERAAMVYDVARKARFPNGEYLYPDVTEGMLQAEIKAARSVLDNNYQEIVERKIDGTKNFDIICYACPNHNKETKECRAEKIRYEMSTMENIRFYFHLLFTTMPMRFKLHLLNLKEHFKLKYKNSHIVN